MPNNKLIYGIGRIPKASEFTLGEIVINVDDSKAYSKNKSNVVFELVGGGSGGDSDWFIDAGVKLTSSLKIQVDGDVSASGNLFALVADNSTTAFKTVVYDTTTGKLYRTGSYGGGGGSGDSLNLHFSASEGTGFSFENLATASFTSGSGTGLTVTAGSTNNIEFELVGVLSSSAQIASNISGAINSATGSSLITASASDTNTIQFTKGDASTFDVIHTASLSQTLTAVLESPVGGVNSLDVFSDGSSIEALLRTMLIEYLPPSLSNLQITNLPSNMEVGDTQVVSAGTFVSSSDSNDAPFNSLALTLANNVNSLVNPSTSALTVSFNALTIQRLTAGNVTFTLTGTPAQGSTTSTNRSVPFRSPIFFGGSSNDGSGMNASVLNSILDDITSSNTPTDDGSSGLIDFDSGFGAGNQTYLSTTSTTAFPSTTKLLLPSSTTVSSNYTYIIYPSSYGTLASIYNGAQVETGTFGAPLGDITHTRYTGIDYYVYRSAGQNAYAADSVLTIDDN
jgi:hypothetical protein